MTTAGQSADEEQIRVELLGVWRLVTWQVIDAVGTISYPLGEDAVGQLMYSDGDRVSAQLVAANQPRFSSDDWREARAEEMTAAWHAYFGYFGTFTIDTAAEVVIHHVEAGWFPNLVGTKQLRHYRLENGRLYLDAETAWDKVRIVWEKHPTQSGRRG
ncbi:MAG TPA: lipocalin-like domain-containing protein [Mycobacteriales bacterium]|jgi:hypothetical protein|nr:lipocalin-like domain-containing protein [Mycobacteriales bacterium]